MPLVQCKKNKNYYISSKKNRATQELIENWQYWSWFTNIVNLAPLSKANYRGIYISKQEPAIRNENSDFGPIFTIFDFTYVSLTVAPRLNRSLLETNSSWHRKIICYLNILWLRTQLTPISSWHISFLIPKSNVCF